MTLHIQANDYTARLTATIHDATLPHGVRKFVKKGPLYKSRPTREGVVVRVVLKRP